MNYSGGGLSDIDLIADGDKGTDSQFFGPCQSVRLIKSK
jgi:hypothetical protein